MSRVEARLHLLEKAYDNSNVKVLVTQDLNGLVLPDGTRISARKGDRIEIPRWMARVLEADGKASIIRDEITTEDVIRIHYREMQRTSIMDIERLPDNFYWSVREYVNYLEKKIREEPDPRLLEEKRRLSEYIDEIIDKRIQSIVLSTMDEKMAGQISSKISPEEQVLMEELIQVLRKWRKQIIPRSQPGRSATSRRG